MFVYVEHGGDEPSLFNTTVRSDVLLDAIRAKAGISNEAETVLDLADTQGVVRDLSSKPSSSAGDLLVARARYYLVAVEPPLVPEGNDEKNNQGLEEGVAPPAQEPRYRLLAKPPVNNTNGEGDVSSFVIRPPGWKEGTTGNERSGKGKKKNGGGS